jgi:hypothetical protein
MYSFIGAGHADIDREEETTMNGYSMTSPTPRDEAKDFTSTTRSASSGCTEPSSLPSTPPWMDECAIPVQESSEIKGEKPNALSVMRGTERVFSNASFTDVFGSGHDEDLDYPDDEFPCEQSQDPGSILSLDCNISLGRQERGDCGVLDTPPRSLSRQGLDVTDDMKRLPPASSAGVDSALVAGDGSRTASFNSSSGSTPLHRVLYSAIASLENPTNSYKKQWKSEHSTARKYEFRSSELLAPLNQRGAPSSPGQLKSTGMLLQERKKGMHKKQSSLSAKMTAMEANSMCSATEPSSDLKMDPAISNDKKRWQNATKTASDLAKATTTTNAIEGDAGGPKSNLRHRQKDENASSFDSKKVTIAVTQGKKKSSGSRHREKAPVEMFRLSSDAYTPRMGKKEIKYKPAAQRTPVQRMASPLGTLSRPNFRDALRRVSMILHEVSVC